MTEISIMSFECEMCGLEVKVIPKDNKFSFYIQEHYMKTYDILNRNGFYRCVLCNHISKLRFHKVNF